MLIVEAHEVELHNAVRNTHGSIRAVSCQAILSYTTINPLS